METGGPRERILTRARVVLAMGGRPTAEAFAPAAGVSRGGLLRAIFFEVSSLAPDTEDAARDVITNLVGTLAMYLTNQMSAGRLRQMHPLLALQSFAGPIFFHLITRPAAERVLGIEIGGEEAVTELAEAWLRGMSPEEKR